MHVTSEWIISGPKLELRIPGWSYHLKHPEQACSRCACMCACVCLCVFYYVGGKYEHTEGTLNYSSFSPRKPCLFPIRAYSRAGGKQAPPQLPFCLVEDSLSESEDPECQVWASSVPRRHLTPYSLAEQTQKLTGEVLPPLQAAPTPVPS